GTGGITDLEFVVQYLVLRFAADYPSLAQYTDDVRILEQCAHSQLIRATQVDALIAAYLAERVVVHQLALDNAGMVNHDHVAPHRQAVIAAWRYWLES